MDIGRIKTEKKVFQTAVPLEYQKGFSKKRIDHRHHAMDAIVIALSLIHILIKDYKTLALTDAQGNVSKLDMPETSTVLQYFTVDGTKISVRPSGTEPKLSLIHI